MPLCSNVGFTVMNHHACLDSSHGSSTGQISYKFISFQKMGFSKTSFLFYVTFQMYGKNVHIIKQILNVRINGSIQCFIMNLGI